MKKIYKVLSAAALGTLFATGVVATASCGNSDQTQVNTSTLESAVKLLNTSITNDRAKVSSDFELPYSITEYGKTYEVNWVSDNTDRLSFELKYRSDGTKYWQTIITREVDKIGEEEHEEYQEASYHGVLKDPETKKTIDSNTFRVRILKEVPASVTYAKWIDGSQTTFDISGYVLAKVGYTESYNEGSLLVWDDEAKGTYFVYQAYIKKDVYDNLTGGEKVTVTGATRSTFNGLLETKFGATATVDTKAEKLDISKLGTDITDYVENDDQDELMRLQSSKVKLSQVKVTKINATPTTTDGKYDTTLNNVVTVTVGEKEIPVSLYQGFTPFSADSTKALITKLQGFKGKYVTLEGYLSWSSTGPVFIVNDAAKVTESTEPQKNKVNADLDEVAKDFNAVYQENQEITLKTTGTNGSKFSYAVTGDSAKIEDGKLKLDNSKKSVVTLTITGKIGDTSINKVVTFKVGYTNVEIATELANAYSFDDITKTVTSITLANKDAETGATYAWTVKDSAGTISAINKSTLGLVGTTTAKTVVVTLTVTYNKESYSRDINLAIPAYTLTSIDDVVAGTNLTADKSYVVVEGYVSGVSTSTITYLSKAQDTAKTLEVYGVYNQYGSKQSSSVDATYPVGTKVTLWGQYVLNNNAAELKNVVILSKEIDDATQAQSNVYQASKKFAKTYTKTTTVTIPDGVTATVKGTSTSVAISGQTCTITPTKTKEDVKITLSSTVNGATKTQDVSFTTELFEVATYEASKITNTKTVTVKHSSTITTTYAEGDVTSKLGVTDANIVITTAKNGYTGDLGINKDGTLRLYAAKGNGNELEIKTKAGYAIKSITITYASSSQKPTVSVNGTKVTGTEDSTKFDINANDVVIKGTQTEGQVQIKTIVVEYGSVTE